MTLLLNLAWMFFGGGWFIFCEYVVAGLLLCVTVVGIPAGIQCFKIAGLGLFPFGKTSTPSAGAGAVSFGFNILWFCIAGVWIFFSHLVLGVALCVMVIGIPFGLQHFKLAFLALAPFGKEVVSRR